MKLLFVCTFIVGFLVGCTVRAGTVGRTLKKSPTEKDYEIAAFNFVKKSLKRSILGVHESCAEDYNFDLKIPKTVALTYAELNSLYREINPEFPQSLGVLGFYWHKEKAVYYVSGQFDTLAHEFVHYFNWNPRSLRSGEEYRLVNSFCLDQISADLIGDQFKVVMDKNKKR